MEHETFFNLLEDPAHWEFELFLIFIFDILIGAIIWPYVRGWFKHHREDDTKLADLETRLKRLEENNIDSK